MPQDTSDSNKPGLAERLRARFAWVDRVMRAEERYRVQDGNLFAAGIAYYTVFALFPLLMVGFAVAGFVLAYQPELVDTLEGQIRQAVPGESGQQLVQLVNSAIDARTSVGVIGMATAMWAGLGWMANVREGLSEMWDQRTEPGNFLKTKLSDLSALVTAFLASLITVGLTALSSRGLMHSALTWLGVSNIPGLDLALQGVSLLAALGVSWLLFTVAIARLPREKLTLRSAARAGLLAAAGFEVFKQLGSIYLQSVVRGPAGAAFGPVLGVLVFAYVTARLLLFATAWAATSADSLAAAPVAPPAPVVVTHLRPERGLGVSGALAAVGLGALGALSFSRLLRRR